MGGRLEGRVGVVTGGGSGIGAETCKRLAADGAAVVVVDIIGKNAERVAEEIRAAGGRACAEVANVADEPSVYCMLRRAVDEFGRLDILFNNAAATSPGFQGFDLDVATMEVEIWDRTMAVNLKGVMLGCKHAIPLMLRSGGGSIINTGSVAALFGGYVRTAYAASKAAVINLTKAVAVQCGKQGIRCNAVLPGYVVTEATRANLPANSLSLNDHAIVLNQSGAPDTVADVVAFLASDDARYMTGQIISVDGGISLRHSGVTITSYAEHAE